MVLYKLNTSMSGSPDLAQAMKASLYESGDLIEVRTRLEEELMEALNQPQTVLQEVKSNYFCNSIKSKPAMPPEIILTNNLIRQYLESVGLKTTSSVLCTESGLPKQIVCDSILQSAFPSLHWSQGKPLLCSLVKNNLKSED